MSTYLMTQSLLSAWQYIYKAREDKEEEAYDSFLRVLNREPTETTKAMQKGIDFENAVTEYLKGEEADGTVKTVGEMIRGAVLQVPVYLDRTIDGMDFVLYGRIDALKAGVIYDIKYSESYETNKYLDSPQHPMYLECLPSAREFRYLVSDGKEVYVERYTRSDTPCIDNAIRQFMSFLDQYGLRDIYLSKWQTW